MRIINQRRNRSVNFDNVEVRLGDTRIFAESGREILLGEYDTEERALEVFEEIHKFYVGENILLMNNVEFDKARLGELKNIDTRAILTKTDSPTKVEFISGNSVYYMPIS